jgi:antitoxin component YwqK of YwqJK toxin-antitoxin module
MKGGKGLAVLLLGIVFIVMLNFSLADCNVYQEDANEYSLLGSWTNDDNILDGNWSSYESVNAVSPYRGGYYLNYTKPTGATGAIWQIKYNEYRQNPPYKSISLQVPASCFDYNPYKLIFKVDAYSPPSSGAYINFSCYDGNWIELKYELTGTLPRLYEEAIIWDTCEVTCTDSDNSIAYTLENGGIATPIGEDRYERGYTTDQNNQKNYDVCIEGNDQLQDNLYVVETICVDNKIANSALPYECPNGCSDGACIPTCGDGVCSNEEKISTCFDDCGPNICGNGYCEKSDLDNSEMCEIDCGQNICGNGICDMYESSIIDIDGNIIEENCFADCPNKCGDGTCSDGEQENCFVDCKFFGSCFYDSDEGINYYERSMPLFEVDNVFYGVDSNLDFCSGNTLVEYYCNNEGGASSDFYDCPNGCSDGACIQEPKTCEEIEGQHTYCDGVCEKHLWEEGFYISFICSQTDCFLDREIDEDYIVYQKYSENLLKISKKFDETKGQYLLNQDYSSSSDCDYVPYKNIYRLFVPDNDLATNDFDLDETLDFCKDKNFKFGIKSLNGPNDGTSGIYCVDGEDFTGEGKCSYDFEEKVSETVFEPGDIDYISPTALANGNILIAYRDENTNEGKFVIYDKDGNQIKAQTIFNLANVYDVSATTLANGNVLIAYNDYSGDNKGKFVIFDEDGNQVKAPTVFEPKNIGYISPTALANDNVLIAYRDENTNEGKFVIYDKDGNQIKAPTEFEAGATLFISATTLANGNVLIAYNDYSDDNKGKFVIFDEDGNQVKAPTVFELNSRSVSTTVFTNGNILIAYEGNEDLNYYGMFVIFDEDGNQVKAPTEFESANVDSISTTALMNGNVLIAYEDVENFHYGTYVIIDKEGNYVKSPTEFEAGTISAVISATTLSNGNVLIAYGQSGGKFVIYGETSQTNCNEVVTGTITEAQNKADTGCINNGYNFGIVSNKITSTSYEVTCLNNTGDFHEYTRTYTGTFEEINYDVYQFCLSQSDTAITGYVNEWDGNKSKTIVCLEDPSIKPYCEDESDCPECDEDEIKICKDGRCGCVDCETNSDCSPEPNCQATCTDNVCNNRVSCKSVKCGDEICNGGETYKTCPSDCKKPKTKKGKGSGRKLIGSWGGDPTPGNNTEDWNRKGLSEDDLEEPDTEDTTPLLGEETTEGFPWLFVFWMILFLLIFLAAVGAGVYYWRKYELEGHEMDEKNHGLIPSLLAKVLGKEQETKKKTGKTKTKKTSTKTSTKKK